MHIKQQSRRQFCKTLLAGSFVLVHTAFSHAGGNDLEDLPSTTSPISRYPRDPVVESFYTQSEFVRLGRWEIVELSNNRYRGSDGKRLTVKGFSQNMATYLVDMIDVAGRNAKRLIRDMEKLKSPEKRKARLAREVQKIERQIEKLEASKKRAEKRKAKSAVYETEGRIKDAKAYLKAVKVWQKFPHEGTR